MSNNQIDEWYRLLANGAFRKTDRRAVAGF
jgi:hypothetical protein